MRRSIFLFSALIVLGSMMTLMQVYSSEADCKGAVNIYACPNSHGCLVPSGGGVPIYFTTDNKGFHFEGNLCAGTYYICVENCGTGSFTSDGQSEGEVHITNNADCKCP
jgi:hypothetical protein